MDMTELLRLSSKGQVVIPKSVRERLNLKEGDRLVAFARRDLLVMRKVENGENILSILSEPVRKRTKELGVTREDVTEAVSSARRSH
jgi:AbrB family looped-hinge helix DNA binding protein